MQRRILSLIIFSFLLIAFLDWSCTKLDTTTIGSDLLPAVDNVHTFDTLLTINTTQILYNDTSKVGKTSDHALGIITNDPLFGKTNADIFFQLKPAFFPFYYGNPKDTLVQLDSVVLCLKYKGFWGDSNQAIHLTVKEVVDKPFNDSAYVLHNINYSAATTNTLGATDVNVLTMANYVKFNNGKDSGNNQIRIKLSQSWAQALFNRDSTAAFGNNAFYSDSIFRNFYNGLAVIASAPGNGLIYVNLADTTTKLQFFYKRRNVTLDTVMYSFKFGSDLGLSGTRAPSSSANHVVRNRAGYPANTASSNFLYIQTSPGAYINLNIPALSTLSNRVIHRAEIIVEQVPNPIDPFKDVFTAPSFMYIDLKDSGTANNWKPIYFDLSPNVVYDPDYKNGIPYFPGQIDFSYYGGYRREKTDNLGNPIKYYNINVSKYIQHLVTNHSYNYDLRLYAPYNLSYPQYSTTYVPYQNNLAFGRIRVGSGTNPDYKLRLRIVYSKL